MTPVRWSLYFPVLIASLAIAACGQSSSDTDAGIDGGPGFSKQQQWVMGTVLDYDLTPVVGASLVLDDMETSSDSAGRFGFSTRAGLVPRAVSIRADGFLPAERQLAPGGGVRVELGAIVLHQADASVSMNGSQGGHLEDSESGVEITVPPGAFSENVDLAMARIELGDPLRDELYLPAALPAPLNAAISGLFALQIDAGGAQPAAALDVHVKIAVALPADTQVPVGRFDIVSGKWVDEGLASVDQDGRLQFQVSHLSTYAAALPALPGDDHASAPDLSSLSKTVSNFKPDEPRIDPVSGALQVGLWLPPLIRGGKRKTLSLFHDSRTVIPKLELAVAAPDAVTNELLCARVSTPLGSLKIGINVRQAASDSAAPAVMVKIPPAPLPQSIIDESPEEAESLKGLSSGTYQTEVFLDRAVEGKFARSASGLFTDPSLGDLLTDDGKPVATPTPVALVKNKKVSVAVDNRMDSPFGAGWQLAGLTRLIQPFCSKDFATLVGGIDKPAIHFGKLGDMTSQSIADQLVAAGVDRSELRDLHVAVVGNDTYVSLASLAEVFLLDANGGPAVLVAGGGSLVTPPGQGKATELNLGSVEAIATGPKGEGLLIVTPSYISLLDSEGNATRVVGTGANTGEDDIKNDKPALESTFFQDLAPSVAADPSSDRFVFSKFSDGAFEVKDGILKRLRLRVSSPHWHHFAFNSKGELTYTSDTGLCIYRFVDGLTDPELFPRCRESLGDKPKDGQADEALAGVARAMAYDSGDNLWFVDGYFRVLRKLSTDGELVTLSAAPPLTVTAGPTSTGILSSTVLGFIESLALRDDQHLWMAGSLPEDLIQVSPVSSGTLTSLSAGDGSLLRQNPDGTWLRVLGNGAQETYDSRGLLLSRGQAGAPPMEYVYEGDWSKSQEEEICGIPLAPPKLDHIEFAGEVLWSFEYQNGLLRSVTDAALRSLGRVSSLGMDRFDLPGGQTVEFRYDDDGRVIDQRKPGPGAALDTWLFTFEDGRLSSYRRPGQAEVTVESAQASVAVSDANAAGLVEQADARIPAALLPSRSGELAKVTLQNKGLKVSSPAGDETEMESDDFGRLMRIKHPDGSMLRLGRDEAGRVTSVCNETTGECYTYRFGKVVLGLGDDPYLGQRLIERVDPAGRTTWFDHDADGSLSARRDANGGIVQFENVTEGAAKGLPRVVVDAKGRRTQIEYDEFGNMKHLIQTGYDGGATATLETVIERDDAGFVVSLVEPSGRVIDTDVNAWGEVIRRTVGDPADGHVLTIDRKVSAAWCGDSCAVDLSPVSKVTDGLGRTWNVAYEADWRQTLMVSPVAGSEQSEYDSQGRLTRRLWDDSSAETITYDATGRIAKRQFAGPASGAQIEFEYDELGRVSALTDPALRQERVFGPGIGWDQVQWFARGSTPQDAAFTLKRTRLGFGITDQTMGNSRYVMHRGFDDNIEQIEHLWTDNASSRKDLVLVERDLSGRLTKVIRANGTQSSYFYDPLGRPVRLEEQDVVGTHVFEWDWSEDHPIRRTLDGVDRLMSWDDFGRLVGCSDTGETYTWDKADERSLASGQAYERDAAGRLVFDGVFDYSYDVLGRRTLRVKRSDSSDRTVYLWGPGGHLASVLSGPAGVETELVRFEYDGSGSLVARTDSAGTTRLSYLPDSERAVRVLTPDMTEWHLVYAFSAAGYSAAVANDGRVRYLHLDPFDRVIGVSDQDGVLTLLDEDCFGARLSDPGLGTLDFGFHGILFDQASGLYLAGARVYDPIVGEFLSPDPKGLEAAPSVYGYAGADPILAQDPGGKIYFFVGAVLAGAYVFNEIRKFAQSDDVKRTKRSYERMSDVADDDSALKESEHAHENLSRASKRGGQTALKATKKAYDTVTSPAEGAGDLMDGAKDLGESIMEDSSEGTKGSDEETLP